MDALKAEIAELRAQVAALKGETAAPKRASSRAQAKT
jgi:hypothetical protein